MRVLLPLLLVLVGLSACKGDGEPAVSASESAGSKAALAFPHPEGFGEDHGLASLEHRDTCSGCHREDDSGAPSCASCHEGYPHPTGWLAGAEHGPAQGEDCAACHATATAASPACTDCHSSYPHASDWSQAGVHGAHAQARGSAEAACGSCHGATLEGSGEAEACVSCHADYPHGSGWQTSHQSADQATCASCHGDLGTGGVSAVSCASCHPGFPHPEDQLRQHMVSTELRGAASCMACHEPGDGPETMPASCGGTCHAPVSEGAK